MLKLEHALISIALLIIVAIAPSYSHDTRAIKDGIETHSSPVDTSNCSTIQRYDLSSMNEAERQEFIENNVTGPYVWSGNTLVYSDRFISDVDRECPENSEFHFHYYIEATDGFYEGDRWIGTSDPDHTLDDIDNDPPPDTTEDTDFSPLVPHYEEVVYPQVPIENPDKVIHTTTYTGINVVIPIASDTADSEVISEVVSGRGSATQPPPKLTITHIETYYRPYYIIVYVLNDSGRFASTNNMRVIMLDGEGNQKQSIALPRRDGSFTYQDVNCRKHKSYISPDEVCTNNAFVVASAVAYKNWDYRKHTERFKVRAKFRFGSKSNRYNPDTDIVKLVYIQDKEYVDIGIFPEEEIAASPSMTVRKTAVTWAELKRR